MDIEQTFVYLVIQLIKKQQMIKFQGAKHHDMNIYILKRWKTVRYPIIFKSGGNYSNSP